MSAERPENPGLESCSIITLCTLYDLLLLTGYPHNDLDLECKPETIICYSAGSVDSVVSASHRK